MRETDGLEAMGQQMARYLPLQQASMEEIACGPFRFDNLLALSHHADTVPAALLLIPAFNDIAGEHLSLRQPTPGPGSG